MNVKAYQPRTKVIPTPRQYHASVVHNNSLFVLGGHNETDSVGSFYEFNLVTNRWDKRSGFSPRHAHVIVVHDNILFAFGGMSDGMVLDHFDCFDFRKRKWSIIKPLNSPKFWGSSAIAFDNSMFLFGGMDPENNCSDKFYKFDFRTHQWATINCSEAPSPRHSHSVSLIGHKMYLFGGYNDGNLSDFWYFDLKSKNWTLLSAQVENISPRGGHVMFSYNGNLFLHGGKDHQGTKDDVYKYNEELNLWERLGTVFPRSFHSVNVWRGSVYIVGGLEGQGIEMLQDFTFNKNLLTQMAEGPFYVLLSYLDSKSITSLACTCRELNKRSNNEQIWRDMCLSLVNGSKSHIEQLNKELETKKIQEIGKFWKRIYFDSTIGATWSPFRNYSNAQLINSKEYKLSVFGRQGVGKSASVIQFIQGHFVLEYDPTIEDSYRKLFSVDGKNIIFDILDTAQEEEYAAMWGQYMRTSEGVIIMYSITDRESFEQVSYFVDRIRREKDVDTFPWVLVGNKLDLVGERQVSKQEGIALAQEYGVPFFESSAKDMRNVYEQFVKLVWEVAYFQHQSKSPVSPPSKKPVCCAQ